MPSIRTLYILALMFLAYSNTWAASVVGSAQVNLLSPLEIGESSSLDFGNIINVNGSCEMQDNGALVSSGTQTCDGTQIPAEFIITGDAGNTVDIVVQATQVESGLTFIPKLVGESNRVLTSGSVSFNVVGTLNINNANQGVYVIPYVVTVNYQ